MTTQSTQECYIYDALHAAMAKANLGALPSAHVTTDEDGAINFTFYTENARLGFNIEVDPGQSGWFVITKGGIMEWGHLDTFDAGRADRCVAIVWGDGESEAVLTRATCARGER